MDPIKQRIAIAEACGWRIYESNGMTYYEMPGGIVWNYVLLVGQLPNYLNDLNAMHEALKALNDDQIMAYQSFLLGVANGHEDETALRKYLDGGPNEWHGWAAQEPEAKHKAEAFLKTIGKWEE